MFNNIELQSRPLVETTAQFQEVYIPLLKKYEKEGIEFDEIIFNLLMSIRERIYEEAHLTSRMYTIKPNYLHIFETKEKERAIEMSCQFSSKAKYGEITPSSARSAYNIDKEEVMYTEVSYEEIPKRSTSF